VCNVRARERISLALVGSWGHGNWSGRRREGDRESEREPEQDEHVFIFSQNISCKLRAKNKKNTHALILSRSK